MGPPKAERALRGLVADLARANQADVDAVLDELQPDQKRIVQGLLDAYLGQPASRPTGQGRAASDRIPLEGFSPAVAERLEGEGPAARRMTKAALEALRAGARGLPPEPSATGTSLHAPPRRWAWPGMRRKWGGGDR